jgi:flagellar assembly factor FliW
MKVQTKDRGLVEADELQKVYFPEGLFGFESLPNYILLDAEQQPFYWLQSLDESDLAFIIMNPFLFRPDFEIDADDSELAEIGIKNPKEALVFCIVTIPETGPITANLQGPLVINKSTRQARQIILSDPRWQTKHDVVAEFTAWKTAGTTGGPPC